MGIRDFIAEEWQPFWVDLTWCFPFWETGVVGTTPQTPQFINVVNPNQKAVGTNTQSDDVNLRYRMSEIGPLYYVAFGGTTRYLNIDHSPGVTGYPFTMALIGQANADSTYMFEISDSTSITNYGIGGNQNNSSNSVIIRNDGFGVSNDFETYQPSIPILYDKVHLMLLRCGVDGQSNLHDFWVDGRLVYTSTDNVPFVNTPDHGTFFQLRDLTPSNGTGGQVGGAWVWNRQLSVDEIIKFSSDPFGMLRHKQDTIHTNVYPMQRNVSQQFTKKIPLKPSEWNIDRTQLRPEFTDLDIMFAWEGSTSLIDRNSGTQANLGSEYGQNQVVQEHFGDVLDFISDPNAYGTGVRWVNGIDQDYLKSGGPITLEALIKVDVDAPNDSTSQIILAIGTDTDSPYDGSIWLYTRGGGETPDGVIDIVAQRRTTASWQSISNGSVRIPKNQWVHVVVTISAFTGGPVKLYVNGILRTTESASGGSGAINNANSNVIVGDHTGGEEFHGKIAYTRVYRDVLDQSQIQMLSKDPWGPIRHYRDTQPVQILAPQLPSHLSVIVTSTVPGNSIVISPVPSNGSFMTIS